jgi:hypothetical protein
MAPTWTDSSEMQQYKIKQMEKIMSDRMGTMGIKGGAETKVINGKTYKKVTGGWEEQE